VGAWLYWDLVWVGQGGLVSLGDSSYNVRDQYYSLRHFARFTDPGDVRVGMSSNRPEIRASAYAAPDGNRVTMVLLNVGAGDETVGLDFGDFVPASLEAYRTVYRPGSSERWTFLGDLATLPSSGALPSLELPSLELPSLELPSLELPSRSVVTVVLQR
jgi:hypothetical protein